MADYATEEGAAQRLSISTELLPPLPLLFATQFTLIIAIFPLGLSD